MSNKVKGREHNEHQAVHSLSKKKGVQVVDRTIFVTKEGHDCGNKTWGVIDYLTHYCGYFAQWKDKETKGNMIKRSLVQ